jgi:hypothetical protein
MVTFRPLAKAVQRRLYAAAANTDTIDHVLYGCVPRRRPPPWRWPLPPAGRHPHHAGAPA